MEMLLAEAINRTVRSGGNVVIPTFAIERAQELMFYLDRLTSARRIPPLLVFLDSPMALDVNKVFERHSEFLDEEAQERLRSGQPLFRFPGLRFVQTIEESKAINTIKGSCIIMAGSGMCTGGRIKHHLVYNISRPESTVLFVGYQARGTLGRQILEGSAQVRIFGQYHPVRAVIAQIHGFSGHADKEDLLGWLNNFVAPPLHLFLTHGEEENALSLADEIYRLKKWIITVPEYGEEWELD